MKSRDENAATSATVPHCACSALTRPNGPLPSRNREGAVMEVDRVLQGEFVEVDHKGRLIRLVHRLGEMGPKP